MPNYFAYFMLIIWPFIAGKIFKKCTIELAVILIFLVPYLLLPVKTIIDLPLIPPLDKASIPALAALYVFYRNKIKIDFMPDSVFIRRTLITLFLFPIFTVIANGDTLNYGSRVFAGLGLMDIVNMCFSNFAYYMVPLVLACQFLRTDKSHELLIKVIAVAGLVYSIPVAWEIRMSPQLHSDIYGFFPHSFRQQARQGGFRAIVFLGHGLLVAMLLAMSLLAIAALWKQKIRLFNTSCGLILIYIFSILILSKSLGALMLAILGTPLILFFGKRLQIHIASFVLLIVISFPLLRTYDIIPIEPTISFFQDIDADRAGSLKYRFDNEDILLEKANLRSIFGWGTWGRNRVIDPYSGRDLSVTDGIWVIIYGTYGWVGYITIFFLMSIPVLIIRKVEKRFPDKISQHTATLCLLLMVNVSDLIPNASISSLTFIISGAILGRAIHVRKEMEEKQMETAMKMA